MATQIKRDLYADVTSRLALSVIKSELREGPYASQSSEPEAPGMLSGSDPNHERALT
jgi:hypothetical protein